MALSYSRLLRLLATVSFLINNLIDQRTGRCRGQHAVERHFLAEILWISEHAIAIRDTSYVVILIYFLMQSLPLPPTLASSAIPAKTPLSLTNGFTLPNLRSTPTPASSLVSAGAFFLTANPYVNLLAPNYTFI